MIYSENLLFNSTAENVLEGWTVNNVTTADGGPDSQYFVLDTSGSMYQEVIPLDLDVSPDDFEISILFKLNDPTAISTTTYKSLIEVKMFYSDGTNDLFQIPCVKGVPYGDRILNDGWYKSVNVCPVQSNKTISKLRVTIQTNNQTGGLYVTTIKLKQNTGAEGFIPDTIVGLRARGAWIAGRRYEKTATYTDVVDYNGKSFLCSVTHISTNTNHPDGAIIPTDTEFWLTCDLQGVQGPINKWYRNRGAWISTTSYVCNDSTIDTVNYLGNLFASKVDGNLNNKPPETAISDTYWTLVVARGNGELDWIKDWNGTRVQIKGTSIVTPRLFAGINGGTPDVPLLTGIAIGRDVLGGTDANIGIVAYNNNQPTIKINTDGSAQFGIDPANRVNIDSQGSMSISGLVVGKNVTMGPTASITWDQVTGANKPNITKIDADGVYTGIVKCDQISSYKADPIIRLFGDSSTVSIDATYNNETGGMGSQIRLKWDRANYIGVANGSINLYVNSSGSYTWSFGPSDIRFNGSLWRPTPVFG